MGLSDMRQGFARHSVWVGGALALIMIVGVVFTGLGSNLGNARGGAGMPGGGAGIDAPGMVEVARVGSAPVTRAELDNQVEQQTRQQTMMGAPPPSAMQRTQLQVQALEQVKTREALVVAAKAAGITATDADVEKAREAEWARQKGDFARSLGLKETASDSEIDAEMVKQGAQEGVSGLKQRVFPAETLRLSVYAKGLQDKFKKDVKTDEAAVKRSYNEILVRHILVKSGEGGLPEAQAKAKAEKLLAEVKKDPSRLASLATQFTDDEGSKAKAGLYDWSPANRYVPAFTDAALAAGVGKVYPELVATPFGFHIVKLEGERPGKAMPKDFDKNKQKYIDQYVDRIAQSKVQEAIQASMPGIEIKVTDPLLRASQLQFEAMRLPDKKASDAKMTQALAELAKVDPKTDTAGIVPLQKAAMYEALGKKDESIAAYKEALTFRNGVDTRLALANLYIGQKNNAEAVKQLDEANKLLIPDVQTQFQLAFMYDRAGRKDLAKKAQAAASEMLQRQMAAQKSDMGATLLNEKGKASGDNKVTVPPGPKTDAKKPQSATVPPKPDGQ